LGFCTGTMSYPARPDGARYRRFLGGRRVVAIGPLVRYRSWRTPRDVPSLTNLRRQIAEVGGALGPPIVKGGTPREAR
jgi:hypothetical protein